jgi:lipopolysaccharide/colanic/teichoic acid biosynthesis glycosyltransferase
MNKDLERARKELDERETQKMFKAIKENHSKAYDQWLLNEQVKKVEKIKEEKRVNFILVAVVILTLFFMLVALITTANKMDEVSTQQCINAGYSKGHCEYVNQ